MSKHDARISDRDRDRILYRYKTMLDIIGVAELTDNVATGVAYYFRAQIARLTNKNIESTMRSLREKNSCVLRDHIPYVHHMIKMLRERMNLIIHDDGLTNKNVNMETHLRIISQCDVFMQNATKMGMEMLIRVLRHQLREEIIFDACADTLITASSYNKIAHEMDMEMSTSTSTDSSDDEVIVYEPNNVNKNYDPNYQI